MAGLIGSHATVVSSGAERKKHYDITTTTTSLTGLQYTPTKVHVYHNGIRLVDGTDYTATNGTSITLTNAAENGDDVVVISYATFQASDTVSKTTGGTFVGDVTFSGAFTSQGIDDNATSTTMTLDSSGNLLVGTTGTDPNNATTSANAGMAVRSDGRVLNGVYQDFAADFNRINNNGEIIRLSKDGTTVGSIGTNGNLYIQGPSGTSGAEFSNNAVRPWKDGARVDATVDLGVSAHRFKDLYLSGGVYLGGTGSANYLDDYEEGTWTGSSTNGFTQTVSSIAGTYYKVGRLVNIHYLLTLSSAGYASGYSLWSGLPFTNKPLQAKLGVIMQQGVTHQW